MSEPRLSVTLDTERCILTGTCEQVAPGLFAIDDAGVVQVLHEPVPAALVDSARAAAAACPTRSLQLQDT
jgi:ferredoxin